MIKKLSLAIFSFYLTAFFYLTIAWGESVINPTEGLNQLIEKFEKDQIEISESIEELAEIDIYLSEFKKNGGTFWGSENWMKSSNYYKNLDTIALARECFSRPIFSTEMMLFPDNSKFAFKRLIIMHEGYAELFKREDMWKGILAIYEDLSLKLNPESPLIKVVEASGGLESLEKLYDFPPFKKQVKGRERAFLNANLTALMSFKLYLENYDAKKVGTILPFYREPCTVSRAALMLLKQFDSQKYMEIAPKITNLRFPQKQKIEDIRSYLNQVITSLHNGNSNE